MNLKCIFNLPRSTQCWLTEELSGGNHAQIVIYKRFVKFVHTIVKSDRRSLKFLLESVCNDVRSLTGGNLRKIHVVTGIKAIPGATPTGQFRNCRIYVTPEGEEWRLPLLQSLLEVRSENWDILFNEEEEEQDNFDGNDISAMIEETCTT